MRRAQFYGGAGLVIGAVSGLIAVWGSLAMIVFAAMFWLGAIAMFTGDIESRETEVDVRRS